MASTPNWIGTNMGGRWALTLFNQVGTRVGQPPANTDLITIVSATGGFVEDIRAKPLGTNVATVLLLYLYNPILNTYFLFGSQALAATTAPGPGSDTGMADVKINVLPETLFPSSSTTTPNRGFRLGQGVKIAVALDVAVATGWCIYANAGEC
jgi:hypothetical protein